MTITHRTLLENNITVLRNSDIVLGARGGILLSLNLEWQPVTYFNINTDDELIKGGDIHVLVTDSSTSRSPIGQIDLTHPVVDSIIVPSGGDWFWSHPEEDAIESSAAIAKLAFNPNFTEDPIGILRGPLRLRMEPDPNRAVTVAHSLAIEVKFLAFDSTFA